MLVLFSILLQVAGQRRDIRKSKLWRNDFQKVLFSMNGPEWAELRLKLVTEITLYNEESVFDDIKCPAQLLSVLQTMNCKNTSSIMEVYLLTLQFFRAISFDPKVLDSLIQRNCSQMPHTYVYLCQASLAGKLPFTRILELIDKCYKEQTKYRNINLPKR